MTVRKWILTLCIVAVLGIVAMLAANRFISDKIFTGVTMPSIKATMRAQYEYGLKSVVEVEAENLEVALRGITDPQEQYRIIERDTDYQRFFPNDEGYFFTYNMQGMRINVPVNHAGNFKDFIGLKDHNGVMIVQEFIKAVRQGGGFVEYHFDKPGAGIQPKLSYVAPIRGTDAFIGTGVYIDGVQERAAAIEKDVAAKNGEYSMYEMTIGCVLLLIVCGLGILLISCICTPLAKLTEAADSIAEGDLSVEIPAQGSMPLEIRTLTSALDHMLNNLKIRIKESAERTAEANQAVERANIATGEAEKARAEAEEARRAGMLAAAERLTTIVDTLSNSSNRLLEQIDVSSKGADDAANRLAHAADSMQNMNVTVQDVARNASAASNASTDTREKAQQGAEIVEVSLQSIEQVRTISRQLTEDMSQLNDHAQNITRIMGVISDIADQTNLLALNAAIEAARAGEAGRGFAVVADEVRKLAEKTMASTTDVRSAIVSIQQSTEKSMSSMEQAVRQVDKATDLAGESGQALKEIVSTVDATADQVHAIATASDEQSSASNEITNAIATASQITRDSAVAMHDAARVVNELMIQVRGLTTMINDFKKS